MHQVLFLLYTAPFDTLYVLVIAFAFNKILIIKLHAAPTGSPWPGMRHGHDRGHGIFILAAHPEGI
jgi:hypothetical protein